MLQHNSQANRPNIDLFSGRFRSIGNGVGQTTSPVIQPPSTIVVPAGAFRTFMQKNRLDEVVEGLLESVNVNWIEELHSLAAHIKEIIHSAPIPEPLYTSIAEGYQGLGRGTKFVWPETTPSTKHHCSRERTQSSYLEVTGLEETFEAIKWWWASLFDANLIRYRELDGQSHGDVGITVLASQNWSSSTEPTGC